MRSQRGKRSEMFSPSIVMRKWLNIKPKLNDFSEDEFDTESEDNDGSYCADGFFGMHENKYTISKSIGDEAIPPLRRLHRRKSESLRVNYISNKDVRVMIGTWNVAGRTPSEDLDLEQWLCTQEPADMYVLGFQEVVPLSAGNVLGAEDNRPIPKWEAIIRRTLNKTQQPKGSISISMSLFQTRLCFVCSHLASGHKSGDQQKRNSDVDEILQRTRFSSLLSAGQPQKIPSHDRIFWFGDLNYRIDMLDAEVRDLVAMRSWGDLLKFDQLTKEVISGSTFVGWKEGLINFPPTYKYEINSSRYVGDIPNEGEKKRTPAW